MHVQRKVLWKCLTVPLVPAQSICHMVVNTVTPTRTMIAKLPVLDGKCDTVTMMSYGMDPYLMSWSPYHGAEYAVLTSVAKDM